MPFTYPLVRKRIPGIDGSTKGSKNKSTLERAAGITPKSGKGRFGVNRCHYQNSASQTGRPLVPMCTSLAGSIPQEVPKRPRIGGFGVNRCHYQNSASQSVSGNDRNCAKISVSDQRSAGWFVPSRSVGTPARHGVNRDGSRAAVVVAADVAPLSSTNTNMRSRRSRGLAKPRC